MCRDTDDLDRSQVPRHSDTFSMQAICQQVTCLRWAPQSLLAPLLALCSSGCTSCRTSGEALPLALHDMQRRCCSVNLQPDTF